LATLVILPPKNNALFIQKSPVFGQTLHQAYLGQAILFKNQHRYGTHYSTIRSTYFRNMLFQQTSPP